MGLLDGKTLLVTGAGHGIGRECALIAASAGAKVMVNDVGSTMAGEGGSPAPAQAVVDEIVAGGGVALASGGSVADMVAVNRMVEEAGDVLGGLHGVIHAAGIVRRSPIETMSEGDWDAVIDVHLKGAFNVARASLDRFLRQGDGAYVFFTSTAALVGDPNLASYAAAKMGVVGLSRIIAMENAEKGVRSNVVAPFAWTRMVSSIPVENEAQRTALEKTKLKMRADQVAKLCVALCDRRARATGQIFGGRGNEIMVFSQPRPVRSVTTPGGWSVEQIVDEALPAVRAGYTDLGASASVFDYRIL